MVTSASTEPQYLGTTFLAPYCYSAAVVLLPAALGQSAPVRTSSGGLSTSALGGLSSSLAGAAAAAGAAASGRGAGPDHREVRYADGVLAMINVLRLLTLGGPRTWDVAAYKQVRL